MDTPRFVFRPPVAGRFQFGAVTNVASVNMPIQSVWTRAVIFIG